MKDEGELLSFILHPFSFILDRFANANQSVHREFLREGDGE